MIAPPTLTGNYEEDYPRIRDFFESISTGIDFDNLDGEEIAATTGTAGAPLVVNHKLGRVPTRFVITGQDKVGSVIKTTATIKTVTIEGSVDTRAVTFLLQEGENRDNQEGCLDPLQNATI